MNYETFVDKIRQRAGASEEQTEIMIRATLETLADRLTAGEVLDLAAQLPKPLQTALRPRTETAERFDRAEFIRRTSERAGIDEAAAATAIRAVFTTLREAVTSGEFDDVLAQLPRDFAGLIEPVPAGRRR